METEKTTIPTKQEAGFSGNSFVLAGIATFIRQKTAS
jgi:hypothetical protein